MIWFSYLSTNQAYESCSVRTNVVHSIPSFSGQILLWTKWANSPFLFIVMYMGWVLSQSLDGQSMSFTGHCPWATPRVNFCHIEQSKYCQEEKCLSHNPMAKKHLTLQPARVENPERIGVKALFPPVFHGCKRKKKKEKERNLPKQQLESYRSLFPFLSFFSFHQGKKITNVTDEERKIMNTRHLLPTFLEGRELQTNTHSHSQKHITIN